MIVSRHKNSGQNLNLLTANIFLEIVAKLKYLGTVTNKIFFLENLRAD
jgi:hypothetical protein